MRWIFSGAAISILVALTGCTIGKLATTPNRSTTSPRMARAGISYALPKVQYEVKLTRTLAECPGEFVDKDKSRPTALKFQISAVATPSYVAGESYTVDYAELPGWLRTASFEIKLYPNGTLKSLGASAEDRTAETMGGAVKTALSVATVLASAPVAGHAKPPASGEESIVGCKPQTLLLVHETDDLDKRLKQSAKNLAALQAQAEYFKSAGTARLIDASGKAQFLKLLKKVFDEEQNLNRLKERQDRIAGSLSVTSSFTWSGDVTSRPEDNAYPLSASDTAKLASLVDIIGIAPLPHVVKADKDRRKLLPECYGDTPDINIDVCLQKQLNVRSGVQLFRNLRTCKTTDAQDAECLTTLRDDHKSLIDARDDNADSGIFIREAMEGRLLFCREISLTQLETPSVNSATGAGPMRAGKPQGRAGATTRSDGTQGGDGAAGGTLNGQGGRNRGGQGNPASVPAEGESVCDIEHDEAKIAPANFPQYGQLRFLPFWVGTFQAREMALSMTETGRLDAFTYKSTKAPAEQLVSTTSDVAGQYATFREVREAKRRDDAKYERDNELANIQAQIDTLTKQAELKKLLVPEVDPLKPTKDQTAAIDAEIALLKAKAELIKAEAAVGTDS